MRGLEWVWLASLLVWHVNAQVKPVTTHLSAKWADTPLLQETAEFMQDESPGMFWEFVDAVAKVHPSVLSEGN